MYLDAAGDPSSGKVLIISVKGDGTKHISSVHRVAILHCRLHLHSTQNMFWSSITYIAPLLGLGCAL